LSIVKSCSNEDASREAAMSFVQAPSSQSSWHQNPHIFHLRAVAFSR
jgi:hypothetical protein